MSTSHSPLTLALDIGATKVAIALVDDHYVIQSRLEVKSAEPELSRRLLLAIEELVEEKRHQVSGVGIASAGPIHRGNGTISPVNIAQWRNFPIIESLKKIFPTLSPILIQDAVSVALAEHRLGAGIGATHMLGMVVSTGIGGGLIINNQIHHGLSGNAGFFGHHSISYEDELCSCGRTGCVELYARGPAMVERAVKFGWGGTQDFESLAQSAREGDFNALEAIDFGARALAVGIVNVMAIVDVNIVVVGGGVSKAGEIYWSQLRAHFDIEANKVGFIQDAQLIPAKLGSDAGLLGAVLAAQEML